MWAGSKTRKANWRKIYCRMPGYSLLGARRIFLALLNFEEKHITSTLPPSVTCDSVYMTSLDQFSLPNDMTYKVKKFVYNYNNLTVYVIIQDIRISGEYDLGVKLK